eukprot:gene13381-15740_t
MHSERSASPDHMEQQMARSLHPSLHRGLSTLDDKDVMYPPLHAYNAETQKAGSNHARREPWASAMSGLTKRRVCIVTTEIEGPVLGGGIGTAYTALAQKLQANGHNVTVALVNQVKRLTPRHWVDLYASKGIILEILDFSEAAQPPVVGCTGPCIRSYRTHQWLLSHDGQFDYVHFHDNGGIAYFATLARHQGVAYANTLLVIGAHGPHMWERTANGANLDDGKHFEVDFLERRAVELADWLVSPSNYMLNWMRRSGWVLPTASYVHQNLLPGDSPTPTDTAAAGSQPHSFDELVFFGRLETRKGLDIFVRAIEKLADTIRARNIIITFLGANTKLTDIGTMADVFLVTRCTRMNVTCRVMVGKTHTEAIGYLTDENSRRLIVIPSPIDNSPNTVLECLANRLPFIAARVGGIPELIHIDDRRRTLFHPKPASLVAKIRSAIDEGVYPAQLAIDEWTREKIWSNWHSVAARSIKRTDDAILVVEKLSIVLVSTPTNSLALSRNLDAIELAVSMDPLLDVEVVVAVSTSTSMPMDSPTILETSLDLRRVNVSEYLVSETLFQPWNSEDVVKATVGAYILFVDVDDWLQDGSIKEIISVARHTGADMISGSVSYPKLDDTSSVFMGCIGMPGIMYNCYGGNSLLLKRSLVENIGKMFSFAEMEDEVDYGGVWELYAEATSKGFTLETIPITLFSSSRVQVDSGSTYNQELRVMRYFEGMAPLATRHFLISKNVYMNEITTVNQKSKALVEQCERGKRSAEKANPAANFMSMDAMDGSVAAPGTETRDHIGMLFVRGHEKSGTSWLKKVLNLHPRIYLAQQEFHFHFLEDGIQKFTDTPWAAAKEPYASHTRIWYRSFVRNLVLSGVSPSSAPLLQWAGEKTPSPLSPVISGSKYVLIIRDGRDVVVSLFWHFVRLGGFENWCGPSTKHLVDPSYVDRYRADSNYFQANPAKLLEKEVCFRAVVKSWAKRVKEDLAVIEELESNPVAQVFVVRYEELHRDPETTRQRMYEFLNLDYGEAEELSLGDKTAPGGFQEEGANRSKFFRKGEIGDWKNYFTRNNAQWFKEEAGHLLIQLGYELDNSW